MNKPAIAKKITRVATGFAVATTVRSIIRSNVPPAENAAVNLLVDASIFVTSFAVSGMAHDAVSRYTDAQIDAISRAITDFNNRMN